MGVPEASVYVQVRVCFLRCGFCLAGLWLGLIAGERMFRILRFPASLLLQSQFHPAHLPVVMCTLKLDAPQAGHKKLWSPLGELVPPSGVS
jgi:hypothetical protein